MSLESSFFEKLSPVHKIRKRLRNKKQIRVIDLTEEVEEVKETEKVNINITVNYNDFDLDSSEIEYEENEQINNLEGHEIVEIEEVEDEEIEDEEDEEEDSMDDFIDDSDINQKDEQKVIRFLAKERSKNRLAAIDSYKNTELEGRLLENIYKELATSVGYFHPGNDSLRKFIFKYYLKEQFPFEYPTDYEVKNIIIVKDICSVCGCNRSVSKQFCFAMDVKEDYKYYQFSVGPECFERIDTILQTLKLAHQYFVLGENKEALNLELSLGDCLVVASKQRKKWKNENETEQFD